MYQSFIRAKIISHFGRIQSKNSKYSLRALARDFEIGSTTLSDIINCKKKISKAMAEHLAKKLQLSPQEQRLFREMIESTRGIRKKYQVLTEQQATIHQNWYCVPLLSLVETEDFRSDPRWIGHRLGITSKEAKEALQLLSDLRMISFEKERWHVVNNVTTTPNNIPNQDARLQKAHFDNIKLAYKSLEHAPP